MFAARCSNAARRLEAAHVELVAKQPEFKFIHPLERRHVDAGDVGEMRQTFRRHVRLISLNSPGFVSFGVSCNITRQKIIDVVAGVVEQRLYVALEALDAHDVIVADVVLKETVMSVW